MCIISFSSNNIYFSRIIEKNPNNPIVVKKIRLGNSFGYYTKNNYCPINDKLVNYFERLNIPREDISTYITVFKDGLGETSYKYDSEDKYDYMNALKYSSTNCIINLISEYYKSLFKYTTDTEKKYIYTFYFNLVFMKKYDINIIGHFKKYFSDVSIDYFKYDQMSEEDEGNYYIIISHNNPQKLVKICYLLFVILSIDNYDFMADDAIIDKIVDILKDIDSQYYIRNIVLSKIIKSEKKFTELIDTINASNINSFSFTFGNNQQNRIKFANSNICNNSNIIDFGCGEGSYAVALASKADNYICFDIDTRELKKAREKIKRKSNDYKTSEKLKEKYNNIMFFSDKTELYNKINSDIIMLPNTFVVFSEVIEHIELEEAKNIFEEICGLFLINPSIKIIMTTPNRDFNHNYLIEELRHDDHKFEFTKNEFIEFINNSTKKFNESQHDIKLKYEYYGIGDSVDGVFTIQGIIIHN